MLAELRIQRTAVTQNSKCESCAHYDGNAAAKGGACDVGSQPFMCGDGHEARFGYAPLDTLAPDMIDDIATPVMVGAPGAMNETGAMETPIQMKQVVLGDELLTIAERIKGDMMGPSDMVAKSMQEYGQTTLSAPMVRPPPRLAPRTLDIAKALREMYMSPRQRAKYSERDVVNFLGKHGYPVSLESLVNASVEKGGGEGSKGGHVIGHTKSGKPVYADKQAHEYTGFSRADHADAGRLHRQHAEKRTRSIDTAVSNARADGHNSLAR